MEPSTARTGSWRLARRATVPALLWGIWFALCCAPLRSQEPSPQPAAQAPAGDATEPASPAAVRPAELDTFMVPGKDGKLIEFFDFPYEELLELYRIKHRLEQPDRQPRYSLQRLDLSGKASGTYATLHLELTVLLESDQWVKVPLGLGAAVPRGPLAKNADAEQFLHFDRAAKTYVVWLRGKPKQQRTLSLDVLVPLVRLGNETVLRLAVPRAATSRLTFDVDAAGAVARVGEGATLVSSQATGDGRTEFIVLGAGGQTELAWRKADQQATGMPVVLEASGIILTRIDGRSAGAEARLTVRSFGGPFDHFRIRLPPGATLVGGGEPGYTLTPVVGDISASAPADTARLVDVKLDRKTSGPIEVRLVTEQLHKLAEHDNLLELAGFEVLGAVRQFGHIAVQVVGQWQVQWASQQNVRRVENLPELLRRDDVVAGFEYIGQPCRLAVRVVPRRTRIRVEPRYVLLVGAKQARLEASLKYTVHGAQVFAFDINLRGWQWDIDEDKIGPENLVDVDAVTIDPQGILHVPLHQPSTAPVELLLNAHRDIPAEAQTLELPLPVPRATSHTSATVVVLPDDNVRLTPSPEATVGLAPQQFAPQSALPPREQDPLFYRADLDRATFAATIEVHPRSIVVDVLSQISVDEQGGRVDETLAYDVAYKPVGSLVLHVPQDIAGTGHLEVSFQGKTLQPVEVNSDAATFDTQHPLPMRVDLPLPQIGRCELRIRYPLADRQPPPEESTSLVVPLVMPADGKLGKNKAVVTAASTITVGYRGDVWIESNDAAAAGSAGRKLRLVADRAQSQLPLTVQLVEPHAPESTIVERAWLQTWLTRSARQDRAVYRLTTNQSQLEISLPAGVEASRVEVKLDGWPVAVESVAREQRAIVVRLPEIEGREHHQLELRYDVAGGGARPGRLTLDSPKLADVLTRHIYWQLVLPRDVYLINTSPRFTPEYVWDWYGLYWGRQATMEQRQLEAWCGATPGTLAPATANRYLFSTLGDTLGNVGQLTIRTASRSLLVLASAGAVLIVGLLLIYIPASRQAGILFAGCVVMLASGLWWYPEPVLLVAQAATLGLVLTLLAGLLRLITQRRRPHGALLRGGNATGGFSPATEAYGSARSNQPIASEGSSTSASTTISLQTLDSDS